MRAARHGTDVFPLHHGRGDVVPDREWLEPEERGVGLIWCSRRTVKSAVGLEEVDVGRIAPAAQWIRAFETMACEVDDEWREPTPARKERHGPKRRGVEGRSEVVVAWLARRHIDRLRDRALLRGPRTRNDAIVGSSVEIGAGRLLTEQHALIFGGPISDVGQRGGVLLLDSWLLIGSQRRASHRELRWRRRRRVTRLGTRGRQCRVRSGARCR